MYLVVPLIKRNGDATADLLDEDSILVNKVGPPGRHVSGILYIQAGSRASNAQPTEKVAVLTPNPQDSGCEVPRRTPGTCTRREEA